MRSTINGMIKRGLDLVGIGSPQADVPDIDWAAAGPPAGPDFPENDPVSAVYSFIIRGIRLDVPRFMRHSRIQPPAIILGLIVA